MTIAPGNALECLQLGDSRFAAGVRDGVARIEELISTELNLGDDMIREAMQHPYSEESTQLRPLFTVLAAQLGPEPDAWQVTVVGAALELIHLATLSHSGVAEDADVVEDAVARWNSNLAILAGDYRYAVASRLGSRLGPQAFSVIAETFAELVTGQLRATRDVPARLDPAEHHLRVAQERTGALIGACGQLGALCAGAPDDVVQRLSRLGRLVGTVFHLSHHSGTAGAAAESHAELARAELADLPDSTIRQAFSTLLDCMLAKRDDPQGSVANATD